MLVNMSPLGGGRIEAASYVRRPIPPPGTSAFNAYRRATGSSVAGAQAAYAAQQAIPPAGTSANKAYQSYLRTGQVAGTNLFSGLRSGRPTSEGSPSGRSSSVGSSSVVSSPVDTSSQPETFDYLDAPWASAYKMSRETAYSEALNNTAYQRSVKDMQRAGLNPAVIFGAGNGYTAGVPAYVSSGTSVSSGSSRSGSSGSGRSKSSGKLFSTSAYSVMSALGGIVGALATKSAGGYWIGTSLTQGAMSALSLLSKSVKR